MMTEQEDGFESWSDEPLSETEYAQRRLPNRLYTSKSFSNNNSYSSDYGQPSRFVYQVFDDDGSASELRREGEEWFVTDIDGTRTQVKVLISRETGALVDLWFQRVPKPGTNSQSRIKDVLRLRRDDALRLAEFFHYLKHIEPAGADTGVRLDEETMSKLLNEPATIERMYKSQTPTVRSLIQNDRQADDVIALEGRRESLRKFDRMLSDDDFFESLIEDGKGKEAVWQNFFENNPWILGIGLGTQLFTSWAKEKLEQVVDGHSVAGSGKRADGLLRTSGLIQSMVFAEIKHHHTKLLGNEYRPSVWAMSKELSGGISQAQATVHQAVTDIGESITRKNEEGFETDDHTYLLRPRSFLIIGEHAEFLNDKKQHHGDKIRSFELSRRHLQEPEVVTFDELYARAQWVVDNSTP